VSPPSPSVLPCLSVQSILHTVPNSAWCFNSELILFPQGSVCDAMVQCYYYLFSCTSVYQSQISMFALIFKYALTHNTIQQLYINVFISFFSSISKHRNTNIPKQLKKKICFFFFFCVCLYLVYLVCSFL